MPLESGGLIGGVRVAPSATYVSNRRVLSTTGMPTSRTTTVQGLAPGQATETPFADRSFMQILGLEETPGLTESSLGATSIINLIRSLLQAGKSLPAWLKAAGIALGVISAAGTVSSLVGGDLNPFNTSVIPGTDITLGGPGLEEPSANMVVKEWSTGTAQFYMLTDGRIAVYSKKAKRWKAYRPARHIVVSKNPRMGTLLAASRRIDKLWSGINKKAGKYLKKQVRYGVPTASVLSAVERRAIRGAK